MEYDRAGLMPYKDLKAYKTLEVGKVLSVKNNIIIQTFEENWETNEVETGRTSRPPEYVFKIDDPRRVAGSIS